MTTDKLRELIAKAEEEHISNGILVDVCTDNLNAAIQKQIISRRKIKALRDLLIQAEREAARELRTA